jgi:hypothetical protein
MSNVMSEGVWLALQRRLVEMIRVFTRVTDLLSDLCDNSGYQKMGKIEGIRI